MAAGLVERKQTKQRTIARATKAAVDMESLSSEDERVGSVDQIVTQMVKGVYEGRFVPGQKLIESDLKSKFGVGRGTIREALRLLEAQGLITTSLHRGARIWSFTREEARDILEINENMMALAASLAAQRLDQSDDVDGLRGILDKMKSSQSDVYALGSLRFEFIHELVRLTKNKQLFRHLPRYDAAILRSQFKTATNASTVSDDMQAYENLVRFIVARDPVSAADVMRQYVRSWSRNVQELPDEYFDQR